MAASDPGLLGVVREEDTDAALSVGPPDPSLRPWLCVHTPILGRWCSPGGTRQSKEMAECLRSIHIGEQFLLKVEGNPQFRSLHPALGCWHLCVPGTSLLSPR